eukprot:PhM_4_TR17937/c0_g1_i1/m.13982
MMMSTAVGYRQFFQLHAARACSGPGHFPGDIAVWSQHYREALNAHLQNNENHKTCDEVAFATDNVAASVWELLEMIAFNNATVYEFIDWHAVNFSLPSDVDDSSWMCLMAGLVCHTIHMNWTGAVSCLHALGDIFPSLSTVIGDLVNLFANYPVDEDGVPVLSLVFEWQNGCMDLAQGLDDADFGGDETVNDCVASLCDILRSVAGEEDSLITVCQKANLDHLWWLTGYLAFANQRTCRIDKSSLLPALKDMRSQLCPSPTEDDMLFDIVERVATTVSAEFPSVTNVLDIFRSFDPSDCVLWIRAHIADLMVDGFYPGSVEDSLARDGAVTEYSTKVLARTGNFDATLEYLSTIPTLDRTVVASLIEELPRHADGDIDLDAVLRTVSNTFGVDCDRQRRMRQSYRSFLRKKCEAWERVVTYGDMIIQRAVAALIEHCSNAAPFAESMVLSLQSISAGTLQRVETVILRRFSRASCTDLSEFGAVVAQRLLDMSKLGAMSDAVRQWCALCTDLHVMMVHCHGDCDDAATAAAARVLSSPVLSNTNALAVVRQCDAVNDYDLRSAARRRIFEMKCDIGFLARHERVVHEIEARYRHVPFEH